jgi:hypothetical protein
VFNSVQQTATVMCLTAYMEQLQTCAEQRTVTDACLTAYSEQLQTSV